MKTKPLKKDTFPPPRTRFSFSFDRAKAVGRKETTLYFCFPYWIHSTSSLSTSSTSGSLFIRSIDSS